MERPNKVQFEISTDIGNAIAVHDYIKALELYIDFLETDKTQYCKCVFPQTDSRDTFTICKSCHCKVKYF